MLLLSLRMTAESQEAHVTVSFLSRDFFSCHVATLDSSSHTQMLSDKRMNHYNIDRGLLATTINISVL